MLRKKILLSARDPGAANHIAAIARSLLQKNKYEISIVGSGAALDVFNKHGLNVKIVKSEPTIEQSGLAVSALLDEAISIISEFSPDAILVGLSGPDKGIDEALISCSDLCPTYAFQDYWGDVNDGFGVLPDTFFVIDDEAKRYTEKRTRSRIIVVGLPDDSNLIINESCMEKENRCNRVLDRENILFTGQPLWHLDGYKRTLKSFISALTTSDLHYDFVYRPHPNESEKDINLLMTICKLHNINVVIDNNKSLNESIMNSKVVASCYSTCGYSVCHSNKLSTKPLASVIYLMFDNDIVKYYKDYTSLDEIPYSASGMFLTVKNSDDILSSIKIALSTKWRNDAWVLSSKIIPNNKDALENINNILSNDLGLI